MSVFGYAGIRSAHTFSGLRRLVSTLSRLKNRLHSVLMKKIAIRAFAVQLIMAPTACRNVMNGIRHGPDQFAAGGSLPRDDADRQCDGGRKADGRDTAGGQPAAPRLSGAAQDGTVRETRQRPCADGGRDGALHGSRAILCRTRTHHRSRRRNPQPKDRYAADRGAAGAVQWLPAAVGWQVPEGAA